MGIYTDPRVSLRSWAQNLSTFALFLYELLFLRLWLYLSWWLGSDDQLGMMFLCMAAIGSTGSLREWISFSTRSSSCVWGNTVQSGRVGSTLVECKMCPVGLPDDAVSGTVYRSGYAMIASLSCGDSSFSRCQPLLLMYSIY